jgi:pimeloyl-ACP methyl ester carboxylesterase
MIAVAHAGQRTQVTARAGVKPMKMAKLSGLLALVVVEPIVVQSPARSQVPSELYTRPAQLFAVEGQRQLNMFCIGDGAPAIVFVSGAWENTMAWRRVQQPVSRWSRACSYDRAGLGFSDPATRPSTARNAAEDLKSLLDAARIETPVVLVGHSAGGLYALLFAALYPDRVAGLVLVDPSDPEANVDRAAAGYLPVEYFEESRRQTESNHELLRHCVELARDGVLTPDNTDPYCLMSEPDPVLKSELDRQHVRLQTKEAILSEMISQNGLMEGEYSLNGVEFREALRDKSFGKLPLVLLRRGNRVKHPALPQDVFDRNESIALAGYERMAAYSSIGEVRTVPNSGHHIQLDRPEAVVAAIRQVLDAIGSGP